MLEREHLPAAIEAARGIWRQRMVHEHQSSAVFARLHPQLIEAEAPLETKVGVLEGALEELRHAASAGRIVVLLGGEAEAEVELATEPLPEHAGCTARERALRNVIFTCCMSETAAVALLTAERELAREPAICGAVEAFLRDEIGHARLGWEYLAGCWPTLGEEERRRTERYVPRALEYLQRSMRALMPLPVGGGDARAEEALGALGILESRRARGLLEETCREVIVPQLRAHGVSVSSSAGFVEP